MLSFNRNREGSQGQSSYPNGFDIFEITKDTLREAQQSIKVAAGWFTDDKLFEILIEKQQYSPGCKIEVVLDDNKENYWLPFLDLVKNGATVKLSNGTGAYGRMIEKFCIVDNRVVISGSYNWSKNAKTINHENFNVSEVPEVISVFESKFKELLASSTDYEAEHLNNNAKLGDGNASQTSNNQESFTKEFEKSLDVMIFASVVEYNREELARKGFERSEKCAGDSAIINYELNTVYTEMMNSISTSEQKKEILKAKVNTYLQESKFTLKEKCARSKEQLQAEEDNLTRISISEIKVLQDENRRCTEEITKLEKSDISENESRIKQLTEEKKIIEEQAVKIPFRWYIEIPTYLTLLGVFTYIMLFYSSAAYILIFSERNAKTALKLGQPVEEIGIYYSKAIPEAAAKSLFELLLILLVPVFLVGGLIYFKRLKTSKYAPKWLVKFICILIIDGFIAVAVTKSIHESRYMDGLETEHFKLETILTDMNFYLVFIFGMLSLLIFDVIFSYLLKNLNNRSDVHLQAKKQLTLNQINAEISALTKKNHELSAEVLNKKVQIEHRIQKVNDLEKENQLLPTSTSRKKTLLENETTGQITNLENIVTIAYNKIENELFSISVHFMKDRINIFLQGWNNFIYSYYAKSIAEEKVRQAKEISSIWFNEDFYNSTQLKTYKNEIAI